MEWDGSEKSGGEISGSRETVAEEKVERSYGSGVHYNNGWWETDWDDSGGHQIGWMLDSSGERSMRWL